MKDSVQAIEVIGLNMQAETREEIVDRLAEALEERGVLTHTEDFLRDVYRREQNHRSTVVEHAVWASGKTGDLAKPVLAFARLAHPIIWEGNPDVSLVFLAAFPQTANEEEINGMARSLQNGEILRKLRMAQNAGEIKAALQM